MLIFVIFCEQHGLYKKCPSMMKLFQRQFHEFCVSQSMEIGHLLRYMIQELTSPIASTERKPVTFRRQDDRNR